MATTFGKTFQSTVTSYPEAGFPGLIVEALSVGAYIYPLSAAAQSVTVTIGTISASTNYTVTVNTTAVTVNSASLTNAQTASALADAIKANPYMYARYSVSVASDVITLTHRQPSANETVTATGGSVAFANTASTTKANLKLGRVLALDSAVLDGELPSAKLPTGSDLLLGIGGIYGHSDGWARDSSGNVERAISPGAAINVVKKGLVYCYAEAAVTAGDSALFYRDTANGSLNQLGAIAPASGTGLTALPAAKAAGNSFTISTGEIVVPVEINLP